MKAKKPKRIDSVALITKRNIMAQKEELLKLIKYLKKRGKKIMFDHNSAQIAGGGAQGHKKDNSTGCRYHRYRGSHYRTG